MDTVQRKVLDKISTIDPVSMQNFFTEEEIDYIYNDLESTIENNIKSGKDGYEGFFDNKKGTAIHFVNDDGTISNAIADKMQKVFGEEVIVSPGFVARYSKKDGINPQLGPHYDRPSEENHTLTMSVELRKTFDWNIWVDYKMYDLSHNSAVIFCGTTQVHYRPRHKLKDDDYYDAFVCHFMLKRFRETLEPGHNERMDSLVKVICDEEYDK
jgi:hypothetical protein